MGMSKSEICSQAQKSQLNNSPLTQRVNRFLATPQYILLVMLLAAVSNLFSLELAVYGLYAAFVVYICLFGADLLPLIPIVICCYAAPSARNNPGREETSVFFAGHGGNLIVFYGVLIVLAVLYRLVRDRKQFLSQKYAFLSGMLILSVGYLLSGIGSEAYPDAIWPNLRYGLVQACALILPYILIAGGVDWKKARNDYFAWTGFGMGLLLLVQIGWIYYTGDVVVDGVIQRLSIYTGWGMHNNIGCLLAMMIPFAFYLATKYRRGWIGTVVGSAFLVGVLMSCSRGSILMAGVVYVTCVWLMLHYAKNRRTNFIALVSVVTMLVLMTVLFHRQLLQLFSDLLGRGADPSGRDEIYREGMQLFLQRPVFGNSFFSPGYTPWEWSTTELTGFLPSRWHNTVVQLLTSCGVVGLAAYGFHRFQTTRFFIFDHTKEKNFIGCALTVLVCCSLVDCHFFNIGPVLFYTMGLAFAEKCPRE